MENAVKSPSVNSAPTPFDEDDVVRSLRAVSASLRAMLHAGLSSADVELVTGHDESVRDATHSLAISYKVGAGGEFRRPAWLATVRDVFAALGDAYWTLLGDETSVGTETLRLRAASVMASQVQWSLCDRHDPPSLAWIRLGSLFRAADEVAAGDVAGDLPNVSREFLRAVALFAADIDQLPFSEALASCEAIGAALPFLALGRDAPVGIHYFVDPPDVCVPQRRLSPIADRRGWSFRPGLASEFFDELALLLSLGRTPRRLEGLDRESAIAAVRRLKASLCVDPPKRRARRYALDGDLAVICGFSGTRAALSSRAATAPATWRVTDLSRTGLGASIPFEPSRPVPDNGELVGVRALDGGEWQIGVARRVRYGTGRVSVGIETLCLEPVLLSVECADLALDVIACDPIQPGHSVRLALPPGLTIGEKTLFAKGEHGSARLLPLAGVSRGYDFDLRSYRVL
ncbi:MAG: hypothetical protein GX576_09690 [Thauera phenolivorans]|uniref:Uncharacterized protein n=1 Tax=Thauera phenolivorans TaxID=1792543 RepID=A0A7X7LWH9_9RHOO|nr:hypothetical protein [Thauera phenolivorans]